MNQITLINFRIIKWEVIGEMPAGLYANYFKFSELGRRIVGEDGYNFWLPTIEYSFKTYKDINIPDNSVTAIITGNFSVANLDKSTEEEILYQCGMILAKTLQGIVTKLIEHDTLQPIDVIPLPNEVVDLYTRK